jgi:hypothetical protein
MANTRGCSPVSQLSPANAAKEQHMIASSRPTWFILSLSGLILIFGNADAQQSPAPADPNPYLMGSEGYDKGPRGLTSYQPDAIARPFATKTAEDVVAKPGIEREHQALLDERYDLDARPARGVTLEHGKPLPEGVRVKLPAGTTWEELAAMTPDEIRERGLWPKGFPTLAASHPCNRRLRDSHPVSTMSRRLTAISSSIATVRGSSTCALDVHVEI